MIVIFQSKASGDVIMFGDVAHALMRIMGKDATPQGIVTVEQLPDAIARLRAAMIQDKEQREQQKQQAPHPQDENDHGNPSSSPGLTPAAFPASAESPESTQPAINLSQRAFPLLELLEYSLRKRVPVVWGV